MRISNYPVIDSVVHKVNSFGSVLKGGYENLCLFSMSMLSRVGNFCSDVLTVIGRKVNMAARLMVNYPEVLSCDDDTYRSGKSKLKKEDFVTLPFVKLKGIAEPGTVREYNRHHE